MFSFQQQQKITKHTKKQKICLNQRKKNKPAENLWKGPSSISNRQKLQSNYLTDTQRTINVKSKKLCMNKM